MSKVYSNFIYFNNFTFIWYDITNLIFLFLVQKSLMLYFFYKGTPSKALKVQRESKNLHFIGFFYYLQVIKTHWLKYNYQQDLSHTIYLITVISIMITDSYSSLNSHTCVRFGRLESRVLACRTRPHTPNK